MQFKRLLSLVLALALSAAGLGVLSACDAASRCVLEAENAVILPEYGEERAEVVRANSRSENITSGGKYVGSLYAGSSVTWFFTAQRSARCEIRVALANAQPNSAAFAFGEGKAFSLAINGTAVRVPAMEIAEGTQYSDYWQEISLGTYAVSAGINMVVLTALADTALVNVDYMAVLSSDGEIAEHTHYWKNTQEPATCTEAGYTYKTCDECGYSYESSPILPLGHQYGDYHYDGELGQMVAVCERCGDKRTANKPDSKYFGEVFFAEGEFTTRPDEYIYEAEQAYVCIDGGLNNGTSYIKVDDGSCNDPSGGKLVENISKIGNYIRFELEPEQPCVADLVFRMSNVLYSEEGIAELNPMSDYVYCTIDGEEVDFSYVAFPGFDEHSYFEWRYVVIKDVALSAHSVIEIGPKEGGGRVTMPNTDVLKIYTDGVRVDTVLHYDINDVSVGAYTGGYAYALDFAAGSTFTLYAGTSAARADYVLTVEADAAVSDAALLPEISVNGGTVNPGGIELEKGVNTIVLHGVPLRELRNEVAFSAAEGVRLVAVQAYTPASVPRAYDSAIVPAYDYLKNREEGAEGFAVPDFILEAEEADLGDSVSSREGVELIEVHIFENTGKPASNNSAIGNFAVPGNTITWRFTCEEAADADIVFMLASAYFDAEVGGNVTTRDLQDKIRVEVNGVAVRLDELVLEVDSPANYYAWKAVTVSGCPLRAGENVLSIEALAYGAPNMDVVYIYKT